MLTAFSSSPVRLRSEPMDFSGRTWMMAPYDPEAPKPRLKPRGAGWLCEGQGIAVHGVTPLAAWVWWRWKGGQ